MIVFDNIDIRNVANVKIEDIRVSAIQYAPLARSRSSSPGSVFVRNRCGTRTVTVTFAILNDDKNARQSALSAVYAWAKSDKEYKLEVAGHPDKFLKAVCTEKPNPSLRQWWEAKLRLVFTCFDDPFWNGIEKSVSCGTAFTVLGDAPPLMRIERALSSSASNQAYTLDDNTITFSTIPTGNLVIDLNRETAAVGTASIMQYYTVASSWLVPRTGTQTVIGTGTVKYRERWE